MDTFHPFWTLFHKHSFQPFCALNQLMNQGTDQATGGGGLEAAKRALEEILSCSLSAPRETQVTQEEFNMQFRVCIF